MSRRDSYPAGVPCFVDVLTTEIEPARRFYAGIFGWEFAGPGAMPTDPPGEYFVARVRGADVAGLGTLPGPQTPAAWNTHVAADDIELLTTRAVNAGGSVLIAPFEVAPAGRMAVIADPTGAALTLWQAHARAGAQPINEPSAWAMSLLTTPDPDAAASFYETVLGWDSEPFGEGIGLFRLPGYVGGEPGQPVPRDVIAAMAVADAGVPRPGASTSGSPTPTRQSPPRRGLAAGWSHRPTRRRRFGERCCRLPTERRSRCPSSGSESKLARHRHDRPLPGGRVRPHQ